MRGKDLDTEKFSDARRIEQFGILKQAQKRVINQVPSVINESERDKRVIKMYRWGLILFWAKDAKFGSRMINARAETVDKRPSFREAFRKRRCLIPASGFYEWKKDVTGKQPYYIKLHDDSPLGFAGLWEHWHNSKGELIESCTIITTVSHEIIGPFHDRMPVILNRDDYNSWLTQKIYCRKIFCRF